MAEGDLPTHAPINQLLVIDDDPVMRLLTQERLGMEGFEVAVATGGADGIDAFDRVGPDLVLLDVEMPEVDGFAVCKAIREKAAGRHVPILMLTGRNDIESIQRAYEAGATDFVTKPIKWLILAHRVRYMLRASESFLAVRSQQVRLDEVQHHARLGSWEVDLKTGRMSMSRALHTLIGLRGDVALSSVEKILEIVDPADRSALEAEVVEGVASGTGFGVEHRILASGGVERIVHTQARVVVGANDVPEILEGFTQDITDRRRAEERVWTLAFSDGLTGLANRVSFKLHLEKAVQRASRTQKQLGILYLDLDDFKRVNDTFGHSAGDRFLCSIAERLSACVRDSDVVARASAGDPHYLVSRLGGDEFTILIEDLGDSNGAGLVAKRVLDAIARPVLVEGHEVRTTASIGIAVWPDDGEEPESLLRNADAAMYHAKRLGRGNFQYYRRAFNARALERLELETDLMRAIDEDRLLVSFQPMLNLATGRISGCEALVRWPDSCRGLVSPVVFLPLAESSGLISGLGETVLRQACNHAQQWQQQGNRGLRLSVNVSPSQLKSEQLVASIERVLEQTSLDPRLLELELTESVFIQDPERATEVLGQLRGLGCGLSLDDFGTGYSSLSNLKRFPFDSVKIEGSFVAGIGSNQQDEAIITAILTLARSLGIRVVAEGVETEAQLRFLQDHRCDEVQGFLISQPLGPFDLLAFLRSFAGARGGGAKGDGQEAG